MDFGVRGQDSTPLMVDPELGSGPSQENIHCPVLRQENSPAYRALHDAGLIVNIYRLRTSDDLDLVRGNYVTAMSNFARRTAAYLGGVLVGGIVYDLVMKQFTVKSGHVRPAQHSDGSFFFYGPGVHRVVGLMITLGEEVSLQESKIEHGTRTIVTVPQGFVGLAFDRGQPVLLAPGLHQWNSDTLRLHQLIDMSEDVIRIGPFTLITVDEGYAAITQNNGKQMVLMGGATHMLTHRNWKFEKLISLKIHTDDLGPFRATTADNVVLETIAMVTWRVADPSVAARMAADTLVSEVQQKSKKGREPTVNRVLPDVADAASGSGVSGSAGSSTLRSDVLKQAVASLAAMIGSIRYADDHHVSASDKVTVMDAGTFSEDDPVTFQSAEPGKASNDEAGGVSQIFSVQQKAAAVRHANEICSQYGVSIVAINVTSAIPVDKALEEAMSAGAVAAAGAQQAEIAARGNAKARMISAQSEAEAARIQAKAAADTERLHAQGKKDAAALLETSDVAVDLAKLEKSGQVLSQKTTFLFGAGPAQVPALLANQKFLGDAA